MPNPTRQEIIDAHDELNRIYQHLLYDGNVSLRKLDTAIEDIRRILPPKPQPTMAEVEWDDELHYLAEAEHPTFGKVIMLERSACPGFIRFARAKENDPTWQAAEEKTLTPTGKRYTLTEVQE